MLMTAARANIWRAADPVKKLLVRWRSYIFGKEKNNALGVL